MPSDTEGHNTKGHEPIASILRRLSPYLDKLAGQVFTLEEAVGCKLEVSCSPDNQAITSLQALDFLRQSLEDLAVATLLLGNREYRDGVSQIEIEAIEHKLKLGATKSMLRGELHDHFGEERGFGDDLDLF